MFYLFRMPESPTPVRPSRSAIAHAVLSASPITRLALACPDERLRERAADELAERIIDRLCAENQMTLSI
jgi:hypothetical protein